MAKIYRNFPKIISKTSNFDSTYTEKSPPIFLMPYTKAKEDNRVIEFPSVAPPGMICTGFIALATAFAQGGSTPTLTITMEGCADPLSEQTELSAALVASATTLSVDSRTGIVQYEYGLLSTDDAPLTSREWVRVTDAAETGSGDKTIVRAQFGTTAAGFAIDDHFNWSRNWSILETNDGTTATATTGAVSISGAAATSMVSARLSSEELDLDRIIVPCVRLTAAVGGSGPTGQFHVDLTMIFED